MRSQTKFRTAVGAAAMVAVVIVAAVATATAAPKGPKGPKPKDPPATESPAPDPPPESSANAADEQFVEMMIPHHHQALVLSRLAPSRVADDEVAALADRIDVEQGLEISMMQNWQGWNGFATTDAEQAYQHMLGMPAMVEQMGMATPEQLDSLEASSGSDFDRLYLELMVTHHEGAITMLEDVIINGSDGLLEGWATDMLTTQTTQVEQMEIMLAGLG